MSGRPSKTTSKRTCLKCDKKFCSQGPMNRLCEKCNKDNWHVREYRVVTIVQR